MVGEEGDAPEDYTGFRVPTSSPASKSTTEKSVLFYSIFHSHDVLLKHTGPRHHGRTLQNNEPKQVSPFGYLFQLLVTEAMKKTSPQGQKERAYLVQKYQLCNTLWVPDPRDQV